MYYYLLPFTLIIWFITKLIWFLIQNFSPFLRKIYLKNGLSFLTIKLLTIFWVLNKITSFLHFAKLCLNLCDMSFTKIKILDIVKNIEWEENLSYRLFLDNVKQVSSNTYVYCKDRLSQGSDCKRGVSAILRYNIKL